MNYDIQEPSSLLKPFVRYYWALEANISGPTEPYRVIPQGCVEVMFFYRAPYSDVRSGSPLPHTIITGQQSSFFDLQALGNIGIFSVQFEPHGAKMFFKTPINEVMNLSVSLTDFAGSDAAELEERIVLAASNRERHEIMENYLLSRLIEKEYDDFKRINSVVSMIKEQRGEVSLEQMSYTSCLGKRQLGRVFQRIVGMTPKQYLKIVRFQHVLTTKQHNPDMNLTRLAFECGYYDQAHFVNDFKRITGYSPRKFFAMGEPFSDYFS